MYLIIGVYIAINCFIAGWHTKSQQENFNFIGIGLMILFFLLVGVPFVALVWLWDGIKYLNETFCPRFFYCFYFTDKFNNLPGDTLNRRNWVCEEYHKSGSIKDRIWRMATRMINKRNGYTYTVRQKKTLEEY